MSQYLLLLYSDPTGWSKLSPEQQRAGEAQYMSWGKKPFVVRGVRLALDDGKVMRAEGGELRTTDGPFTETKELLAGYYLIEAASYDEALQRSADHPHLQHGGIIEVRQTYGS
ncbi:MAG: hypothetical protein JO091_14050 [Acidobacteriaceae bacterium]|nr:hypothetical protein [Acidobacteriaceae bacterium]